MSYYLGIDLGGTNIVAAVVDDNYKIIAKISTPTNAKQSFDVIVSNIAQLGKHVLANAKITEQDISYVGVGVPSNIDPHNNNVVFANNLGWKDKDFIQEFKKHWDIDVFMANDANVAALGEVLAGAAKECNDAMMITIGTGLGGGIIMDKKIFLGGDGYGFEPGHIIIVKDGFPCTCGQKGCLESYASATGLIRETISFMSAYPNSVMWSLCDNNLNNATGKTCVEAVKLADKAANIVFDNYIGYLGAGLIGLINAFRPTIVIIGGGISTEGDFLLAPLRNFVYENIYASDLMKPPLIIKAELEGDAGLIGAAFLGA